MINRDDSRIAEYAHVGDSGWLRQNGLFVAEGRLVVRRLIEADTFPIRSILVTPAAHAALADALASRPLPVHICDQETMNAVAGFNFHRGCLALGIRGPAGDSVGPFLSASRLLALEGIGNPDNIGGLFRVAAAFGAGGMLLDRQSGDPLYRKALRTSMGAALQMPFAQIDPWRPALESLRTAGAHLVALTPDRSAIPLNDYARALPAERRLVLMLGAEGPGLSPESQQAANARVCIPIAPTIDSLNVSVAAGIALAALARPRAEK